MRARFVFGTLAGLAIAVACIPHPEQDFEDFQDRIAGFGAVDSGPAVETGPPPTEAEEATYYAACLTELASGATRKVFNFITTTAFTPTAGGGELAITLEPLEVVAGGPPPQISRAGIVDKLPPITGPTNPEGAFTAVLSGGLTEAKFTGKSNPISGSDVVLNSSNGVTIGLQGKFAKGRFCARLTGHITRPQSAERNLDPNKNFCVFIPLKGPDATSALSLDGNVLVIADSATGEVRLKFPDDFNVASCPI